MLHEYASNITYRPGFHLVSIVMDVASISYFLYASFFIEVPIIPLELALGAYFLLEYIILLYASENKWQYVKHPLSISNVLIIIGFLAAPYWNLGILRILRALRIIHLYQIIPDIRLMTKRVIVWEKFLAAIIHAIVLIFLITEVVFLHQEDQNQDINTRFDAFYYTTNAVAKIGGGTDIALVGTGGRVISIVIALISFSLFLQLIEGARETMRARRRQENGLRKRKKKVTAEDMEEIYTEHLCTYCDIKNRDMLKRLPKSVDKLA